MFCTGFKLSYSAYINWLGERKWLNNSI
jgi:hypothetical protein